MSSLVPLVPLLLLQVQKQSLLSHTAQDSQALWEEELKSRSKLGLRLAELEKERGELNTQVRRLRSSSAFSSSLPIPSFLLFLTPSLSICPTSPPPLLYLSFSFLASSFSSFPSCSYTSFLSSLLLILLSFLSSPHPTPALTLTAMVCRWRWRRRK